MCRIDASGLFHCERWIRRGDGGRERVQQNVVVEKPGNRIFRQFVSIVDVRSMPLFVFDHQIIDCREGI